MTTVPIVAIHAVGRIHRPSVMDVNAETATGAYVPAMKMAIMEWSARRQVSTACLVRHGTRW